MGRNPLTQGEEYARFLRQKAGVLPRDWQTDDDWAKENKKLDEIIEYLREIG